MKRNLNAFIQQAQLDAKIEEEAKAILEAAELIDSVCQAFNVSAKEAAEAIAISLRSNHRPGEFVLRTDEPLSTCVRKVLSAHEIEEDE